MSSTVLVPNLLMANRHGVEELGNDGPFLLQNDTSLQKKRKTSALIHDTRSFKRRKFSRSYIEKNLQNKRGTSRFSRRRHNELPPVDDDECAAPRSQKLRTHNWNAKRMHMVDLYGTMVPQQSQRRGLKAVARLFDDKKSFILDSSFHHVFRIECAMESDPCEIFSHITDTNSAFFQTLAHGNLFSSSTPFVEHDILFHAKDAFPTGLIGPCKVLVGARATAATAATTQHTVDAEGQVVQTLQMWLTCHPAMAEEVQQTLAEFDGLVVEDLQHGVDRLEIVGKDAVTLLDKLVPVEDSTTASVFFQSLMRHRQAVANVWRNGYVLPLTVRDPRCSQAKAMHSSEPISTSTSTSTSLSWPKAPVSSSASYTRSPLWMANDRISLISSASVPSSTYAVNHQKHTKEQSIVQALFAVLQGTSTTVPNDDNSNAATTTTPTVPVFLIRHATTNKHHPGHYSSSNCLPGFTLLLPSTWTSIFWQHFIDRGAIAASIDEWQYLQRQQQVLSFPIDYLDTNIGWTAYQDRLLTMQEEENRKPPGKRTTWPFQRDELLALYHNDHVDEEDFAGHTCAVVRRQEYLSHFEIPTNTLELCDHIDEAHDDWAVEVFDQPVSSSIPSSLPEMPYVTYLHMIVSPTGRGQVHPYARLYRPTAHDLKAFVLHTLQRKKKFDHLAEQREAAPVQSSSVITGDKGMLLPKNTTVQDEVESDIKCSQSWRGVDLSTEEEAEEAAEGLISNSRVCLGTVTSGDDENGSNDHTGIAFCRADVLYAMMACHYGRFNYVSSHQVVLFQNPGSQWLRPALLTYLK